MKYLQALKRLINPAKYPLYRTTPLRYIFLHLVLLSMLLAAPAASGFLQSMSSLSQLMEEKSDAIPDFQVENAQLELPEDKDTVIKLNQGTVTFTEKTAGSAGYLFTFSKEKIHINGIDPISYHNVSTISDRESLVSTLSAYTGSVYFYFMLLCLALITIQLFLLLVKLTFISLTAHLIARLCSRKSRYMTWLKIMTFLLTVPVLIQYLGLMIPNALTYPLSWCIITLLTCLAVYHLPAKKKHVNS